MRNNVALGTVLSSILSFKAFTYCTNSRLYCHGASFTDRRMLSITQHYAPKILPRESSVCPAAVFFNRVLRVSLSGRRDFYGGVSHAFLSGLAQPAFIAGSHEKTSRNDRVW